MDGYRISFRGVFFHLLFGWCAAGFAMGSQCAFAKYTPTMHEFGAPGSLIAMSQDRNRRINACFADPRTCR